MEFVKKDGKKSPDPEYLSSLQKECFFMGLVLWKGGRAGNVARVMPALVITEELLNEGMTILGKGLDKMHRK